MERYKPEFSLDQFEQYYPQPESIDKLKQMCQNDGNESCLRLGIKLFYNIKNVTNPNNFKHIIPYFETCARNQNGHCIDFLTQIYFFHLTPSDYNSIFSLNKFSKTVFARLIRANLLRAGVVSNHSCSSALEEISSIMKAAFISFVAEPIHCIKTPDILDENLNAIKSIKKRAERLDLYLQTLKYPKMVPYELQCSLYYERCKNNFLYFLDSDNSAFFNDKSVFRYILQNYHNLNPSFYAGIVREIAKIKDPTEFSKVLFAESELFMLINGSRRVDAVPKLKLLADRGDDYFTALITFANLLKMDPFNDSRYSLNYTNTRLSSPFSEIIRALLYDMGSEKSLGCDNSFDTLLSFILRSPIIYDCFRAHEAVEEGNLDLALLIYERLALMGSQESIHDVKMILKKLGADLKMINILESAYDLNSINIELSRLEEKKLDPMFLLEFSQNPYSALIHAFHASTIPKMKAELELLNSAKPFMVFITYPYSLFLELFFSIRIHVISMLSDRMTFAITISIVSFIYYFGKTIWSCL